MKIKLKSKCREKVKLETKSCLLNIMFSTSLVFWFFVCYCFSPKWLQMSVTSSWSLLLSAYQPSLWVVTCYFLTQWSSFPTSGPSWCSFKQNGDKDQVIKILWLYHPRWGPCDAEEIFLYRKISPSAGLSTQSLIAGRLLTHCLCEQSTQAAWFYIVVDSQTGSMTL